jgi:hypothetical protein
MSLSVMINLDDMLFAAYTLGIALTYGGQTPRLSKEELRAHLLSEVPLITSNTTQKKSKQTKTAETTEKAEKAEKTEKTETTETAETIEKPTKPKTIKKKKIETENSGESQVSDDAAVAEATEGPKKRTRKIPDDETRCCARSFSEKEHLDENKQLKVMRDDEANQFGDRCKLAKTDGDFCNTHNKGQSHGVWDNDYDGKLKKLVEKSTDAKPKVAKPKADKPKVAKPKADKPKTEKSEKLVKAKDKAKVVETEQVSDVESDDEDEYMPANILEMANIDYDWIEIDDLSYQIDAKGNVYDPENEDKLIGIYNIKTKKWISGGPTADDE